MITNHTNRDEVLKIKRSFLDKNVNCLKGNQKTTNFKIWFYD
jgi:hypothetical protein